MIAVVAGTNLTTPDTTRSYTVTVGPHDLTGDVQWDSLEIEDQGSSALGVTSFRVNGSLATFPGVRDQQWVEVYDHIAGGLAFRGFIDSRRPRRLPEWDEIGVIASSHDSLLDNVIPYESRPAGESDNARIGYLWGKYATGYLAADLTYVQQVSASLPDQEFVGLSLRQAIDMIAAQAGSSVRWYLDAAGRPHYFSSESNDAPSDVTSDTPGAGEIAPMDLDIDYDSKSFVQAVYVRGGNDLGSGWVYSESAKANHGGLQRTKFVDSPDCTTAAMKTAIGNMYLGRVGAAIARGSFSCTSNDADGWRAGQNVTVRSSHLNNLNQAFAIARVRTTVLGPSATQPAAIRRYEVEFGGASGGHGGREIASLGGLSGGLYPLTLNVAEGNDPESYGPLSIYQQNGAMWLAANQGGATGYGTSLQLDAAGRIFLYPKGFAGDKTGFINLEGVPRHTDADATRILYAHRGRLVYAYPVGGGPLQTPTTARNLPTSGGAIQIPIVVGSEMRLWSLTIWNTNAASLRTAEWALYDDIGAASAALLVASGSFSFTPGAAAAQTSDVTAAPVVIAPGMYYLVIRNTSATQTFGVGEQAAGTIAPTTAKTQTLGSALADGLDLVTGWSGISALPGVILRGAAAGETGYY